MNNYGKFLARAQARAAAQRKARGETKDFARLRDERLLKMLADARRMTSTQLAEAYETTENAVRVMIAKVVRDDLAYSGEPREVVLKGYGR